MKQQKYAYDKLGMLLHRGSFITYPYRAGTMLGLRVGKVVDIPTIPPSLTWEEEQSGLMVVSAGWWEGKWELSSRKLLLKDATNTITISSSFDIESVFAAVEVVPFNLEEELNLCL